MKRRVAGTLNDKIPSDNAHVDGAVDKDRSMITIGNPRIIKQGGDADRLHDGSGHERPRFIMRGKDFSIREVDDFTATEAGLIPLASTNRSTASCDSPARAFMTANEMNATENICRINFMPII